MTNSTFPIFNIEKEVKFIGFVADKVVLNGNEICNFSPSTSHLSDGDQISGTLVGDKSSCSRQIQVWRPCRTLCDWVKVTGSLASRMRLLAIRDRRQKQQ